MRRSSLLLLGVAVVLAAGCGGTERPASSASSSTTTQPVTTDTVVADSRDLLDGPPSGTPAPPQAPDRNTISWPEAKRLIARCEVREVFQAHSLYVELKLKNGHKRNTREPQIDDVLRLLEQAAGRCGDVGAMVE